MVVMQAELFSVFGKMSKKISGIWTLIAYYRYNGQILGIINSIIVQVDLIQRANWIKEGDREHLRPVQIDHCKKKKSLESQGTEIVLVSIRIIGSMGSEVKGSLAERTQPKYLEEKAVELNSSCEKGRKFLGLTAVFFLREKSLPHQTCFRICQNEYINLNED